MVNTTFRQYSRMLVPFDGSEVAESVFVYVKELAARLSLDVTVLRVCGNQEKEHLPMHQGYIEQTADALLYQSHQVRRMLGTEGGANGLSVHGELCVGRPGEEIVRHAQENDIDLIVMATHGRSGIKRWAMGSVADEVLHACKVPIWLVRASAPQRLAYDRWPSKNILVPLDGSPLAESVLPHVEALALHDSEAAEVILVTVCEYSVVPDDNGDGPPSGWETAMRHEIATARRHAARYLSHVEQRLTDAGVKVRCEVLAGDPADKLVHIAEDYPYALVAMATHGRSGLTRWAYGSVADKMLHALSCPLLLVRPSQVLSQ